MPVSQVPLYREAVADPYALNTGFRILFANDPEERLNPNAVTGHEYYLIEPVEYVRDNSWIMGLSADVPIASRFSVRVYPPSEARRTQASCQLRVCMRRQADLSDIQKQSRSPR
ncbi:MAG: hypothetical protein ACTTJZ_08635 [Sphaerochaetaceae bacterium]